jgi:hypothetical protein
MGKQGIPEKVLVRKFHQISWKSKKKKMGGHCTEGCNADRMTSRFEEKNWG